MTDHRDTPFWDWKKVAILFAVVGWLTIGAAIAASTRNPDHVVGNLLWYGGFSALAAAAALAIAHAA